ncbi:hypothetical protein AB0D74_08600 [Streptomyces sp. NPDC048278]|uniref:hypothetical protein n=1 Tax=Streptomyces sp. NPDC048278 TaxID=3155809 RepID=UPI003435A6C7
MMRGKTLVPSRRIAVALGLLVLLAGTAGVAERAGSHDGARSDRQAVVSWNNTGSSCSSCTATS